MKQHGKPPSSPPAHPALAYAPPRVTGKRPLAMVTLTSPPPAIGPQTGGSNGPDSGWFGHS
jgi:hypothetical protein